MKKEKIVSSVLFIGLLVFSGCGSSDTKKDPDSSGEVFNGKKITLDATAGGFNAPANDANNKYTYFDFSTNQVVNLTDEEAKTDTNWDIAFKRLNVKLNGGASGNGSVTGAVADMQSELYNNGKIIANSIMALDDEKGLVEFNKADKNVTVFLEDSTGSAIAKEWWRDFDMSSMPPVLKANDDNWFVVRSSDGNSYAKIHATSLKSSHRKLSDLRLEMYIQSAEDTFPDSLSIVDINFTVDITSIYYDFDTASIVTQADDWDLKIDNDWTIWTNSAIYGGGQGGVFGRGSGLTKTALDAMITSDGKSDSGQSIPKFFPDMASSVFTSYKWYEFNFNKDRKAWPNYRTYIIKVGDSEKYKVQLINYYNNDPKPVSGYITMRYEAIAN